MSRITVLLAFIKTVGRPKMELLARRNQILRPLKGLCKTEPPCESHSLELIFAQ